MLHALSPKTFLKNFQVSAKNQRMKPDNKIETERFGEAMNTMDEIKIRNGTWDFFKCAENDFLFDQERGAFQDSSGMF